MEGLNMFCGNCGKELSEGESVCSNCGAVSNNSVREVVEPIVNDTVTANNAFTSENVTGQVLMSEEEIRNKVNATLLLVLSIIETILCCCFSSFIGVLPIIALVLYFVLLERDIKSGDLESAKKSAKTITILLIVAPVVSIIFTVLTFALALIPNLMGGVL